MIVELPKPNTSNTRIESSIELPALSIDPSLQIRVAISQTTVDEYATRMKAGDQFPPLVAFSVGNSLLLVDGFHRYHAAKKAGLMAFAVNVRDGTRRDAIAYAIKANATHGLPRTNADKRRAVVLALQEFANRSDRAIAEMCKVSQPFVSSIRRGLKTVISSSKRVGRDGKQRSMPVRRTQQVPTDAKATQPGSITEPDATADHGQQNNSEFCAVDAWGRIQRLLEAEMAIWPAHIRQDFQARLQNFIDRSF